jgi:acetyl-CoA synthetase
MAEPDADVLEQHRHLLRQVPERLVHLRRSGQRRSGRVLLVLVGPFEIESALLEHPAVAESAAIGKPDAVNMEVVKAFVALRPGFSAGPDLELDIMNYVRKKLSPLAMPQEIEFVEKVPKTRSGKILRRVLKAKELGQPIGDISTMDDD